MNIIMNTEVPRFKERVRIESGIFFHSARQASANARFKDLLNDEWQIV